MDYASYGEAPKRMYFWSGVSAIAGALRRRVWVDQAYFQWHPNFYVVLVAPPGIVSKSTTVGIAMDLLKQVPGIHMGPSVVTMQALLAAMSKVTEEFSLNGEYYPMSAVTIESSEFGNLLNPQDKDMVDMLVNLWDGKKGELKKETKHSGNESVINPWLNIAACTTPAWIAGNFPEYMIGGGFTSRCIFVYADKKEKYVAYPGLCVPRDLDDYQAKLVADLTQIASLAGEYTLSREAVAWGESWYRDLYEKRPINLDDERFGGYIARKQTHLHKLAMVLAAAASDNLVIEQDHLATAHTMLQDLEPDMAMVFSKIGKSETSVYVDRLVENVCRRGGMPYMEVYRFVHMYFPSSRDFEDIMSGCVKAGLLHISHSGPVPMVFPGPSEAHTEPT